MKKYILVILVALHVFIILPLSTYVVNETENVIITQFGKIIGEPITDPGIHFKLPIHSVNRIEKRILEWDGKQSQFTTADRRFIQVDSFSRWQISDPALYYVSCRIESEAQSRLDGILNGAFREVVAKYNLIEVVRDTNRSEIDEQIVEGRTNLTVKILEIARKKADLIGIHIVDVEFKRAHYVSSVRKEVFKRMISERKSIAAEFRSQGFGAAQVIRGNLEYDLLEIQSNAERESLSIRGQADAEAADIFAKAYSADPKFYAFYRGLQVFKTSISASDTVVLSSDSPVFKYLTGANL